MCVLRRVFGKIYLTHVSFLFVKRISIVVIKSSPLQRMTNGRHRQNEFSGKQVCVNHYVQGYVQLMVVAIAACEIG